MSLAVFNFLANLTRFTLDESGVPKKVVNVHTTDNKVVPIPLPEYMIQYIDTLLTLHKKLKLVDNEYVFALEGTPNGYRTAELYAEKFRHKREQLDSDDIELDSDGMFCKCVSNNIVIVKYVVLITDAC